jgi:glycosyltransferase involved in cell wall biosynthesis
MKRKKIVLILPAYNAAKSLGSFLHSLPKDVFDQIILVDDSSRDGTYELAKKQKGISAYKTPRNVGYGGNLKYSFAKALEAGADVIVELHPDGEYRADGIQPALNAIDDGAELVLGNRFDTSLDAQSSGMYPWKYILIQLLNSIENVMLGTSIPDLHQGFRVYTKELLTAVNYRANSNRYLFSFEIIAQALYWGMNISSVPVTTRYTGKKRGAKLADSIEYGLNTFRVLVLYYLAKLEFITIIFSRTRSVVNCPNCTTDAFVTYDIVNSFSLLFCGLCRNGFTFPVPKNLATYYQKTYWEAGGWLGEVKRFMFRIFQKRRAAWVVEKILSGDILDVGAGEGNFARSLPRNYRTVSLETPTASITNPAVTKADFLKYKSSRQFDAIVFWESLEHVASPLLYLKKAYTLLKPGGYIFVEYPRYKGVESRLFGKYWFHIDMPRHLSHFTDGGLGYLVRQSGFVKGKSQGVGAYEYSIGGFFVSLVHSLRIHVFNPDRRSWHVMLLVLLIPLLLLSIVAEVILALLTASPIGFMTAQKQVKHGN